ncbi:alpha-beta hydrolase superfamily lysophospholipase [Streptomyces achromogenes]|uniref:Alpha-beta hydrolase superfamily lysophospholipase n=1 Tax=Streptomyces achromogenes TaxID=67255 RepID=A0ABU0PWB9_STRAH|nr:alpha/beta fold hydrolase [Streptomyces achromogenes]MDQ0681990.1 alpha-beta hydrolase superfamily lysophospholipase [Streptomyces achromogenes]MDQ0829141.1 alpha-beta hydrolase superfamily lysophospholipase [Streptomyces achromogenes]
MTSLEPELATAVRRQVVDVHGVPASALVAEVPRPQAVIVALHGGATTSAYFDHPGHPRLSLLRTAAAAGFTVLAPDRPGYGSSAGHDDHMRTPDQRTDFAYEAVEALLKDRERGVGVFLWAHSAGSELALHMANDPRAGELLGVELAGMGRVHHPRAVRAMEEWRSDPTRTRPSLRHALWYPPQAYPPDVHGGQRIGAASPAYEGHREGWQEDLMRLAARVAVPVHITLAEHEQVWINGPEGLSDLASLFTGSPRVVLHEQAGAGHNTSVGRTALAYHLHVLAFVEECALGVPALPTERGRRDG